MKYTRGGQNDLSDLIDRQAAIDAVCESGDHWDMIERLNALPSAHGCHYQNHIRERGEQE